MREMSASEASRNFARVLDEAEHGETIVVTRSGQRVAMIVPAPRANGADLRKIFAEWGGKGLADDEFAENVAAARAAATAEEDADPWAD